MQNLEWYLADLKSMGKNTIETVEKSLTDMFIRLVRIYPCLYTSCFMVFLSSFISVFEILRLPALRLQKSDGIRLIMA